MIKHIVTCDVCGVQFSDWVINYNDTDNGRYRILVIKMDRLPDKNYRHVCSLDCLCRIVSKYVNAMIRRFKNG